MEGWSNWLGFISELDRTIISGEKCDFQVVSIKALEKLYKLHKCLELNTIKAVNISRIKIEVIEEAIHLYPLSLLMLL